MITPAQIDAAVVTLVDTLTAGTANNTELLQVMQLANTSLSMKIRNQAPVSLEEQLGAKTAELDSVKAELADAQAQAVTLSVSKMVG